MKRKHAGRSLLLQAMIISVSIEITAFSFVFLPNLSKRVEHNRTVSRLLNITQNCIVIVNSAIEPLVYFIFNVEVRRYLAEFLRDYSRGISKLAKRLCLL